MQPELSTILWSRKKEVSGLSMFTEKGLAPANNSGLWYHPDATLHMCVCGHVGLHACAGILPCYMWLSAHMHQVLCRYALSKVHACLSALVHV